MITKICKLTTYGDVINVCEYSIEPKPAMVAYLMQTIHHNYNTWQYPEVIDGMYQSNVCPDNWYYDMPDGGCIAAYGYRIVEQCKVVKGVI